MKTTEYKEKFERVFQQIGKATNSIWKVEDQANLLVCKTHIQGQAVNINLRIDSYDKVKARIFLGDYRTDGNCYFSKDISFTAKKSEYQITQEILKRLEVDSLEDRISIILNIRQSQKEKEEYEQFRIEAFRRVLPFDKTAYNGKYSASMNGVTVLFEPYTNQLEIKGNSEMALKICGKIAELLNQ